jgi:hypothetical protein
LEFRLQPVCKDLARRLKPTPLAPGDENCRCQNHFGLDYWSGVVFELFGMFDAP